MWKKILDDKKIKDAPERVGIPLRVPLAPVDGNIEDSEYIINKDKANDRGIIDIDDEFNIDFDIDKEGRNNGKRIKKPKIIM